MESSASSQDNCEIVARVCVVCVYVDYVVVLVVHTAAGYQGCQSDRLNHQPGHDCISQLRRMGQDASETRGTCSVCGTCIYCVCLYVCERALCVLTSTLNYTVNVVLLIVCAISYLLFPVSQLEVAECRRDVPTVLSSSVIKPGSSPSQPTPMDISDAHQSTSSSHHPALELSTSADTEMEEGGSKGVSGDGEGAERA